MAPFKWEGMLPKAVRPLTPPPRCLGEPPASGLAGDEQRGSVLPALPSPQPQHPAPSLPRDAPIPFWGQRCVCRPPPAPRLPQQQQSGARSSDPRKAAAPKPLRQDPCGGWPGDRMTAPCQLSWLLGINGCGHERSSVLSSPGGTGCPLPGGLGHAAPCRTLPSPSRP